MPVTRKIPNSPTFADLFNPSVGLDLKSPDGSTWRLTVDNSGHLITTKVV